MARLFDDSAVSAANKDYIEHGAALATAVPITLTAWFYADDNTLSMDVVAIGRATADHVFRLNCGGTVGGDPLRAVSAVGGVASIASTTTGFSLNTWHHGCAVFASATDRRVFIDGGSKGTNATSSTPLLVDRTSIGRNPQASTNFSGRICEVGIWSAALDDVEVARLSQRSPLWRVRPESLLAYVPIWGLHSPEIDLVKNNTTWTVSGTAGVVRANHAPVSLWTRIGRATVPEIGVPPFSPAWARGSNRLIGSGGVGG